MTANDLVTSTSGAHEPEVSCTMMSPASAGGVRLVEVVDLAEQSKLVSVSRRLPLTQSELVVGTAWKRVFS